MKRKLSLTVFILISILFLQSCGITQELDQSIEVNDALTSTIKEQELLLKDLIKTVEKIEPAFEKDLEIKPGTGRFIDQEGDLYINMEHRKKLLASLEKGKKQLTRHKKELNRIVSKEAVDVDNKKLQLISSSLSIIESNYDSCQSYLETGFEQEETLYTQLPVDDLPSQASILERTFGSVQMVAEETISNMEYTKNLVQEYQEYATSHKK
ncbi:MAG: hypothetical protein ACTJHC_00720 [Vagococcus sp.]